MRPCSETRLSASGARPTRRSRGVPLRSGRTWSGHFAVAASANVILAVTASLSIFSTPRFLAAQRSAVSSRREEVAGSSCAAAQHKQKGRGPFEILRVLGSIVLTKLRVLTYIVSTLFLACSKLPVCWIVPQSLCRAASLSTVPPQGTFALQKSLRWEQRWGRAPPSEPYSPAKRNFQRKFAFRRTKPKVYRSALRSSYPYQTRTQSQLRKRVLSETRKHSRLEKCC